MLGLDFSAFCLLIGAPAVVISVMFASCLKISREKDN